jgi:hypothetical protein
MSTLITYTSGKWNFSNFGKTQWKQFQLPESAKMQIGEKE